MTLRPYRSVLYIPGSRARALEKARSMPVDSIIFDLEDAVALEEKASARATLVAHLSDGGYGVRSQIIRINGLDTPWVAEILLRLPKPDRRRFYCPRSITPK